MSTAASSASCKRSRPPSNLVNGQQLTMCDIVWVSPQSHSSLSVKPHFLWHALQWPWPLHHFIALTTALQTTVYDTTPTGNKTLRDQDTSVPRYFGTINMVSKCPDSSGMVPKCLKTSRPADLDIDHSTWSVRPPSLFVNMSRVCSINTVNRLTGLFPHG